MINEKLQGTNASEGDIETKWNAVKQAMGNLGPHLTIEVKKKT